MQTIHLFPPSTSLLRQPIPLLHQLLQIVCHILLKMTNALCAESMRDGFSLPSVFGAITGVEETTLNGDEGVVVVAVPQVLVSYAMSGKCWIQCAQ